jgi:hypothetical protein
MALQVAQAGDHPLEAGGLSVGALSMRTAGELAGLMLHAGLAMLLRGWRTVARCIGAPDSGMS